MQNVFVVSLVVIIMMVGRVGGDDAALCGANAMPETFAGEPEFFASRPDVLVVADVDRDGHVDLVVRFQSSVSLPLVSQLGVFFYLPGEGVYSPIRTLTEGGGGADGVGHIAVGQVVNGGGGTWLDVVGVVGGDIWVWPEARRELGYVLVQQESLGSAPSLLTVADVDGDGMGNILGYYANGLFWLNRTGSTWSLQDGGESLFTNLWDRIQTTPLVVGSGVYHVVVTRISRLNFLVNDGSGSFTALPGTIFIGSSNSLGAEMIDMDGDTFVDVVYIVDDTVYVYNGAGDGTFSSGPSIDFGVSLSAFTVGDFDQDGYGDVAAVEESSSLMRLAWGQPVGLTQDADILTNLVDQMYSGDVDGDGRDDLVLSRGFFKPAYSLSVNVREFATPVGGLLVSLNDFASGDFQGIRVNGNGHVYRAISDVLYRYESAGGTVALRGRTRTAGPVASLIKMEPADLDNDMLDDMVVLLGDGSLGWFRAENAQGSLSATLSLVVSSATPVVTFVADAVDVGDATVDLVAVLASQVQVYCNTAGTGVFSSIPCDTLAESGVTAVTVCDVNGDTLPDLVTAVASSGAVSVYPGTGGPAGVFGPSVSLPGASERNPVAILSFQPDPASSGVVSLVVGSTGSRRISVFSLVDNTGLVFEPQPEELVSPIDGISIMLLGVWGNVPNVVIGYSAGVAIVPLAGRTKGFFQRVSTGAPVASNVDVRDVDGDGIPELVCIDATLSTASTQIFQAKLGDRVANSFGGQASSIEIGSERKHAVFLDWDFDGDVDMVASDEELGLRLVENLDGLPSIPRAFVKFLGAHGLVAMDADGDGDMDVVACSVLVGNAAQIGYWNNNGLGTSLDIQTIESGFGGCRALVADNFDGDKRSDVVASSSTGVHIFYGSPTSASGFERVDLASAGSDIPSARSLATDRLGTGPGSPSIVAAVQCVPQFTFCTASNKVSYWVSPSGQRGDWGTEQIVSYTGVTGVAFSDFDGDGMPEMVLGQQTAPPVVILTSFDTGYSTVFATLPSASVTVAAVSTVNVTGVLDDVLVRFATGGAAVYRVVDGGGGPGVTFEQIIQTGGSTDGLPTFVLSEDVNSDGDADLVYGLYSKVHVVLGTTRTPFAADVSTLAEPGYAQAHACLVESSAACLSARLTAISPCQDVRSLQLEPGSYGCARDAPILITSSVHISGPAVFDCATTGDGAAAAVGGALFFVTNNVRTGQSGQLVLDDVEVLNGGVARNLVSMSSAIKVSGRTQSLLLRNVRVSNGVVAPVDGTFHFDSGRGGGVAVTDGARAVLDTVTISGCSASEFGGGMFVSGIDTRVVINGTTFDGCTAGLSGGGLYVASGAVVEMGENTRFANNVALAGSGGGLFASDSAQITGSSLVFEQNRAEVGMGGALAATGGGENGLVVYLSASIFDGNTAATGGGVGCAESVETATGVARSSSAATVVVPNRLVSPWAPGMSRVVVENSRVSNNVALVYGGGLVACGAWVQVSGSGSVWDGNTCGRSGSTSTAADVFVCDGGDPSFVGNRSQLAQIPWLWFGGDVGSLGSTADVAGPLERLEVANTGEPVVYAGQGVTGKVTGYDILNQAVVYDDTAIRLRFELGSSQSRSADGVSPSTPGDVLLSELESDIPPGFVALLPGSTGGEVEYVVRATGSRAGGEVRGRVNVTLCPENFGGVLARAAGIDVDARVCVECDGASTSKGGSMDACIATPPCPELMSLDLNATAVEGRDVCVCNTGAYVPSGVLNEDCVSCPRGGFCAGRLATPVSAPGFYASAPGSNSFVACPRQAGCVGNDVCAPGYEGFACVDCAGGYFSPTPDVCERCPPSAGATLVVVLGIALLAVVAGAVFVARTMAKSASAGVSGMKAQTFVLEWRTRSVPASLSMVVTTAQLIAVVAAFDFAWPSEVRWMMSVFSVFVLDPRVLPTGCSVQSYESQYHMNVLVPIIALVAMVLVVTGLRVSGVAMFASLRSIPYVSAVDGVVFLAGQFLYLPITTASLELFDCSQVETGKRVLDAELSFECYTSAWWGLLPTALVGILGVVIGFPALALFRLITHRGQLLAPETAARFGVLYQAFRVKYAFASVVALGIRLGVVSVSLFFSNSRIVVFLGISFFLALSMGFFISARPYYVDNYNRLRARLDGCVEAIALTGIGFYAERGSASGSGSRIVLVIVIVLTLVGTLGVMAHGIWVDVAGIRQVRKNGSRVDANARYLELKHVVERELIEVGGGESDDDDDDDDDDGFFVMLRDVMDVSSGESRGSDSSTGSWRSSSGSSGGTTTTSLSEGTS